MNSNNIIIIINTSWKIVHIVYKLTWSGHPADMMLNRPPTLDRGSVHEQVSCLKVLAGSKLIELHQYLMTLLSVLFFLRSLSFVLRPQFITFIVNYMHICNVLYMWMAIKHHPCHVINIKTYMILSGCGALALSMKKENCMRIEKYD